MPTEQTQERCRKPGCGALKGRCSDWDCPEGDFVRQYEGRAPASPGESTTEQTQAPQGESEVETRMEAELRHAAVNLSIGASYCALSEPEKKALQEYATLIRQSADALDALRAERDALREIVREVAGDDPETFDSYEDPDCFYCHGGYTREEPDYATVLRHATDCLWLRAHALARQGAPTPAQEESDGR